MNIYKNNDELEINEDDSEKLLESQEYIEDNNNIKIEHSNDNIKITVDNNMYKENIKYLKNFIIYIKISKLFIIGFYKSFFHSIYPYWYKNDIENIVIKLQNILLKKKS